MSKKSLIVGAFALFLADAALAQQPATPAAGAQGAGRGGARAAVAPVPGPEMMLALEAVQKIVAVCKTNGFNVSAAVVDSGGYVRAALMAEGTDPRAADFGVRKAITAAKLGMKPGDAAARQRTDAAFKAEVDAKIAAEVAAGGQRINVAPTGGLPIKVGDRVIGGISASGAPQAAQDDVCAQAGLEAIQGRLK